MTKLSGSLFAATMCLAFAAMLAGAQPAAKPEPKPNAPPAPAAAPAVPAPSAAACEHPPCAAGKGAPNEGPNRKGMMQGGMMMPHSNDSEPPHRIHELAALADVKTQTTKFGAVIQLVAKNPGDVAKVQELAREVSAFLTDPPPHGRPGHAHRGNP